MRRALFVLVLAGCNQDIGLTESAQCDGRKQVGEDFVDAAFDKDGDGYFDGTNPGCKATYEADELDCNDGNELISPNAVEVTCDQQDNDCDEATPDSADADLDGFTVCVDCDDDDDTISPGKNETPCNGIDDDCDAETIDGEDADGDGATTCVDCDDDEPAATPGKDEECEDDIDNDCDGETDEDCAPSDYSGAWELDDVINYTCAYGNVKIDFSDVYVDDASPDIEVSALGGTGIQPGAMNGTLDGSGHFDAQHVLAGTCTETYEIVGDFTDADHFDATFTAKFSGGALCLDCTNQSWTVSGTRQ